MPYKTLNNKDNIFIQLMQTKFTLITPMSFISNIFLQTTETTHI